MSTIFRLGSNDLSKLLRLEKECFAIPWDSSRFKLGLELKLFSIFGIQRNQKLLAYLALNINGQEMQILKVAVQKSERQKGLATRLLKFAELLSKKLQVTKITLEVNSQNKPALTLYNKLGYIIINKKENYYPGEMAFILSKQLPANRQS